MFGHRVFWVLMLAGALAGLARPSPAATTRIASHIAFDGPAEVALLEDRIAINTVGSLWLDSAGHAEITSPEQGVVTFSGPADQLLSLLAANSQPDQSLVPLRAMCSVNGARQTSCHGLSILLHADKTTLTVNMYAMSVPRLGAQGVLLPSFDICFVYQ